MRAAIRWDHSRLMDHFVAQHDIAGRLHDLVALVIGVRHHRPHHSARDAAVPQALVQPGIMAAGGRLSAWPSGSRCGAFACGLLRRRRQWRNPAVGRIHNQRCPAIRYSTFVPVIRWSDSHAIGAAFRVLFAGQELVAPSEQRVMIGELGCINLLLLFRERLALGEFFIGQIRSGPELLRPFQRHADHARAGPHAF